MYRKGVDPQQIARLCHSTTRAVTKYLEQRMEDNPLLWDACLKIHTEPSLPRHERGTIGAAWKRWHGMLRVFVNQHHRLPGLDDSPIWTIRGVGVTALRLSNFQDTVPASM